MQTKQSENIFFSYILKYGDYLQHITDRFFNEEEFKLLLPKLKSFYEKYKQTPSKKQAWEIVSVDPILADKISFEKLEAIWNWDISSYDEAWMKETFEAWVEFKNLEFSIFDVVSYVKNEKINQDNIKDVIVKVKEMMVDRNSLDFSFNTGIDFFNVDEHKEETGTYIKTGYSYLDMVLGGGWQRKALYVLAAPPKVGKSLWLCNLAAELIKNGYNVMYYTLEMSEKKVLQRIGSNLLNIPIKDYFIQSQDKVMMKNRMANIEMQNMKSPGKLFIKEFPTGQASTLDLESHCNKVEETTGLTFPVIIVDYLGIMKNWRNPNTENMYLKGKHISEDLRGWGVRKNKSMLSAIQTNKSSVNATDFTTVAVAESSGLNHTVDGMFGIIQDEIMYANLEYWLKTLLNRNDGYKNTKKRFNVNYNFMRVEEDINSEIVQGM